MTRASCIALFLCFSMISCSSAQRPLAPSRNEGFRGTDVDLQIRAGDEISYFLRKSAGSDPKIMASQLRVRSGERAALTVSWPAGNSGIHLNLRADSGATNYFITSPLVPISADGRRGIKFTVRASDAKASGGTASFVLSPITAASMRHIRDVRDYNTPHPEFAAQPHQDGASLIAERTTIDGLTQMRLVLRPSKGTALSPDDAGTYRVRSSTTDAEFEFEVTTTETPLTPVPIERIVTPEVLARSTARQLQQFSYLVYEEAILAGADNYLTMFGRDNEFLLSIGAEGLQPKAFEIVFVSHIEAMRDDGNLAHEPAVGEYAAYENRKAGRGAKRTDVFDYKMIDTRYLLAPSVVKYLGKVDAPTAQAFFARASKKSSTYKQELMKNLRLILSDARPYAKKPVWKNLIALEKGSDNGQWRDSHSGLGNGRYPFDVNVALLPAALKAIVEIDRLLPDPELDLMAKEATELHKIWSATAWKHFEVKLSEKIAERNIKRYGRELGLGTKSTDRAANTAVQEFVGISLDDRGQPVPVLHTDGGFLLLYGGDVPDERIMSLLATAKATFPAGLFSPVGLFISNAAHAADKIRKPWTFTPYHGVVVWPWQEYLWAEGVAAQLSRKNLKPTTIRALENFELQLWGLLYQTSPYLSLEIYSAAPKGESLVAVPWAPKEGNASAMLQAWSELGLLLRPPKRVTDRLGAMPEFGASTQPFAP